MRPVWIAPSILSANFINLGHEVNSVINAGANLIHFDVMDNHYVPNLTFGPLVCEALTKANISVPIDVHLMCSPVDDLIKQFASAGASYITFHPEASNHVHRSLSLIKSLGCKAGLVLNPTTSLEVLEYVMDFLDIILLMSVNPGFPGQSFIPETLTKIRNVRSLIDKSGKDIRLEVDGGIKLNNLESVIDAGADTLVMGSAIFNSEPHSATFKEIFKLINS